MRLGRIFAPRAVDMVEMFGLRVVRLQFVIADGPCGRDSTMVPEFTEIFFTQAEERRSIELGVTTNVVVGVRMKVFAISVFPMFGSLVLAMNIHFEGIPVIFFALDVIAAL